MSFRLRAPHALALAALTALAVQAPAAAAQERSWTLTTFGEFGVFGPLRTLGKNVTSVPQLPLLQLVAELRAAPQFGGGVALEFPDKDIRVRARFLTTVGGDTEGRLGVCGDPDQPLLTGALCAPVLTSYSMRSFSTDIEFVRGHPGARVRPVLSIGFGLRRYDFDPVTCNSTTDWQVVCQFAREIWDDPGGYAPHLAFGAGLEARMGPLTAYSHAQTFFGRYTGGSGRADGNSQLDVSASFGLSMTVY